MQNHVLRVGEELVIPDHIRVTILAVEEDKVVLGITAEPNEVTNPVARQWRSEVAVVPGPLPNGN